MARKRTCIGRAQINAKQGCGTKNAGVIELVGVGDAEGDRLRLEPVPREAGRYERKDFIGTGIATRTKADDNIGPIEVIQSGREPGRPNSHLRLAATRQVRSKAGAASGIGPAIGSTAPESVSFRRGNAALFSF